MPCYDPRAAEDNGNIQGENRKLRDELIERDAMLCAVLFESAKFVQVSKLIDGAEKNGKISGIERWFNLHLYNDMKRLKEHGLPYEPSGHEIDKYDILSKK